MSGFEVNKIFAAILVALIILFIISNIGNIIISIDKDEKIETAYIIDIPDSNNRSTTSSAVMEENIDPVSSLLITASIINGEKIFKKCASCHNYKKNSKSKIGPNLWDIINNSKGNSAGFAYSNDLAKFGGIWTYEELGQFLYKPKNFIKGTKMNFAGLKNVKDRADLILWLRQQSDSPAPLP